MGQYSKLPPAFLHTSVFLRDTFVLCLNQVLPGIPLKKFNSLFLLSSFPSDHRLRRGGGVTEGPCVRNT